MHIQYIEIETCCVHATCSSLSANNTYHYGVRDSPNLVTFLGLELSRPKTILGLAKTEGKNDQDPCNLFLSWVGFVSRRSANGATVDWPGLPDAWQLAKSDST